MLPIIVHGCGEEYAIMHLLIVDSSVFCISTTILNHAHNLEGTQV